MRDEVKGGLALFVIVVAAVSVGFLAGFTYPFRHALKVPAPKVFSIIVPPGVTYNVEADSVRAVGSCVEVIKAGVVDKIICPDFVIFTPKVGPPAQQVPEGPPVRG